MQLEIIAGGMTINPAFIELGIEPAAMNLEGFRYHNEILKRMKKSRPEQMQKGVDQKSVKGLFKMSRKGQDAFQELFFPTKPQPPWKKSLLAAMVKVAVRTDAWLASRAPM